MGNARILRSRLAYVLHPAGRRGRNYAGWGGGKATQQRDIAKAIQLAKTVED